MLIDSHVHLNDKRFDRDRDILIRSLKDNGVELVINIGINLRTSIDSVNLANKYHNIYTSVGVHPHAAKEVTEATMEELEKLTENKKVIAIGETGLDFYYDNSPRDIQRKWFKEQLELAKKLDLPAIIHSREADQETYDIIKKSQDGSLRGVMHCFSGDINMAEKYIDLGFHIALGGVVTFKNAEATKEVAKSIALEKLLIETDCPYLTPVPYRGKRNEPIFVRYVAEKIAEIKDISIDEVAEYTNRNTKELFSIS